MSVRCGDPTPPGIEANAAGPGGLALQKYNNYGHNNPPGADKIVTRRRGSEEDSAQELKAAGHGQMT